MNYVINKVSTVGENKIGAPRIFFVFQNRNKNCTFAKVVVINIFASFFCIGFVHWFMASIMYTIHPIVFSLPTTCKK